MGNSESPLGLGCNEGLGAGRLMREHPICTLTAAEVNHLRRLLSWACCEVGQPPEEMVPMVQSIARQLGEVSQEGKARLVESHAKASNVPKYVRAALKALQKTLLAHPELLSEAEDVGPPALPAPNVRAKLATTAGRQARAGENVPRTARPGLVACRWRSA